MPKWKKLPQWAKYLLIGGALILFIYFLWWPPSRVVLLWMLPLGSGTDDLCQGAAIIIAGVCIVFGILRRKSK